MDEKFDHLEYLLEANSHVMAALKELGEALELDPHHLLADELMQHYESLLELSQSLLAGIEAEAGRQGLYDE